MVLPEDTSIITEEQRDWDDDYFIAAGRTYCFEFFALDGESVNISFIHTKPTAQDLSLRCWISDKPIGDTLYPRDDSMDYFPVNRHNRVITVGTPSTDFPFKIPDTQIVYFMVKNMQNSENLFRLSFEIKA
jgi:hypothetical protein